MFENIALSFQGIWSHKLRSILTMLGIIIGIASIITIVSTIKGTTEQIKENLIGSGNNVVNVSLKYNNSEYDTQYNGVPKGVKLITDKTKKQLKRLAGVDNVSLYRDRNYTNTYYMDTNFTGNVRGVDTDYFDVENYNIISGRFFSEYDNAKFHKCAIVDDTAATIIGANPVGEIIEIEKEPFLIIGVVEKRNKTKLKIKTVEDYYTYSDTSAGTIFIPIDTWPVVFGFDEPQNVVVHAVNTDAMTEAGNNVAKVLTSRQISDGKFSYTADDLLKEAARMQELANATNKQLVWIAAISLLVGGIGVMNIMLVSVTERTKEIGLKKAIGAKRSHIASQFLTEASVLTSIGGLVGVISGLLLSSVVSRISDTPSAVSIPACVIAVLFSMGIGIFFGFVPAIKASKLNPIDALRSE